MKGRGEKAWSNWEGGVATGLVHESGELLTNNHIARSLLHSIGFEDDIGDYRADPILALLQ